LTAYSLSTYSLELISHNLSLTTTGALTLDWRIYEELPYIIHFAKLDPLSGERTEFAIQMSIDKAVSLLSDNINDNSRYFLVEWDEVNSNLRILVTDDSKQTDSKYVVTCQIPPHTSDDIKYWVKDYLTTCSEFFKFSLVAVFQCGTRDKLELL